MCRPVIVVIVVVVVMIVIVHGSHSYLSGSSQCS